MFGFVANNDQYMSLTFAEECKGKSFEEWRWEFYSVFEKDRKEERDGLLVAEYLQTRKFRKVPLTLESNNNLPLLFDSSFSTEYFTLPTSEEENETPRVKELIITDGYRSFFNNDLYSDFTIKFMKQGKEINSLKVHKMVLAENSDFFKNMFSLGMIESNSNELIVDLEEEKEYAFVRMIQSIYDPTILFRDMFLNYELILLFDKYGFDTHKRTLIRNVLATRDNISFFQYMFNNLFVYEIVVDGHSNELIQAINRNPNVLASYRDLAPDLLVRYSKKSFLNEFQWNTFSFLYSAVEDKHLKEECFAIAQRKFSTPLDFKVRRQFSNWKD
ncbi:predicted protein [Naegleria gruberi]|uniref:Predicted protein n=1 Tax=Naegleria gruberi TaxID=5762 RepID=D2VEE7_NAEGR|nr:uncharacterized protein NAEGRDRAFT_67252 [Naegleria gruberi]EFC44864.1 predicted protein [Naegleria gruberi]|eukprot:XP_002677608.1 predicted protein [Naegleria gruberi strain NEG-M]